MSMIKSNTLLHIDTPEWVGVELENGQRDEFSWVGGELDQERTKRGIWLGSLVACVDFFIEKGHKDRFGLLVGVGN